MTENFFDNEIEARVAREEIGTHVARPRLEPVEVVTRIVEAVHVIDPEAVDPSLRQQLEGECMGALEDHRVFHADRGKLVDVEKSPIVDFLHGNTPVREPVCLHREQSVEAVEAPGASLDPVQRDHRTVDVREHRRRNRGQPGEPALDHFLFAIALRSQRLRLHVPPGKALNRGEDAEELDPRVALAYPGEECLRLEAENAAVRVRRDRKDVIGVTRTEHSIHVLEGDLLSFEHCAIGIAKDRQQDLVFQLGFQRMPVDIEELRIPRARTVLEHVLPPRVGGMCDAHVIGHEVDDVTHATRAEGVDPAVEGVVISDFRVQLRRIRDVVAVSAPGHRFEITRCITVRNTERIEVVDDGRGRIKGK